MPAQSKITVISEMGIRSAYNFFVGLHGDKTLNI
jgi:hypothetical protein